ncbi:MAG: hypothetical protein IT580_16955 [Verrucomicrobiales bacterium]|nr:hypothetical protein [Verrucomicrobiales bacterium]
MFLKTKVVLGATLAAAALSTTSQAQPATRAGVQPGGEAGSRYYTEFSHVFDSSVSLEGVGLGDVSTTAAQVSYQVSIPTSERYAWIVGMELRGTWFDAPDAAPIPDGLYETSLRVGNSWRFADRWRLQTLVSPGLYSDLEDVDGGDFNAPLLALAFWSVRENLDLIGGLSLNLRRDVPVIPALGARWGFADKWTLLAVYPSPRVEYAASDAVTVFAGAELVRTAYRVGKNFGSELGRPALNDEDLSYNEWRVGAGVRWSISRSFVVALDGGWAGDREFNFEDADVELDGQGAPYLQLAISGSY